MVELNLAAVFPAYKVESDFKEIGLRLKDSGINLFLYNQNDPVLEFERAFVDNEIDAIIAGRGGFGCAKITDNINWELVKNNPKPFFGYSDITILLNKLNNLCGVVSYHSAVLTEFVKLSDQYIKSFRDIAKGVKHIKEIYADSNQGKFINAEIVGGNLTVLASIIGTNDDIVTANKVLFLEDVNEALYRVERSLWQLYKAGRLVDVKAIMLGEFVYDNKYSDEYQSNVFELVASLFPDLLVINKINAGHAEGKLIFPIGEEVKISY